MSQKLKKKSEFSKKSNLKKKVIFQIIYFLKNLIFKYVKKIRIFFFLKIQILNKAKFSKISQDFK